jgi:hypothetical protein
MAIIKSSCKKSSKRETDLAADINRLHDLFTNDGSQVISSADKSQGGGSL